MSVLGKVIGSGVARRRVQTLVIGLATLLAVTASVLGGALLVSSEAPFEKAFERQHGAQLTAQFDASRATTTQLAASARASGVTAAAGPFPTTTVTPGFGGHSGAPLSVAGRATSGGEIDKVTVLRGRWAEKPGEIVVSADTGPEVRLGQKLELPDLPGSPTLTVVGVARTVSRTADAWVLPSQIPKLTPSGRVGGYQMLYRFAHARTAAQLAQDRAALTATLPAKSLTGAQSWLGVKKIATRDTALFVPFLVAFGILGLVMSVLIVGNVVAGAVTTGTRRIGVLKAVGCTPGQVVRACAAQALIPATAGAALGTAAGHLLATPILSDTADAYGTAGLGIEAWVDVTVIGGMLGIVTTTACASAWRSGRLRTADALAVGRTPVAGRGRWAARTAARLPAAGRDRRTDGAAAPLPSAGRDRRTAGTTARPRGTGRSWWAARAAARLPVVGRDWRAASTAARRPAAGQNRQTAGTTARLPLASRLQRAARAAARLPVEGRDRRAARTADRLSAADRDQRTAGATTIRPPATDRNQRAASTTARPPETGRGQWAAGAAARLPLSRPVGLGLARPFARPGRAVAMVVAVLFGAVAVTFATGLSASLGEVIAAKNHNAADVTVGASVGTAGSGKAVRRGQPTGAASGPVALSPSVVAAIAGQPGTRAYYGSASLDAAVSGMSGPVSVTAFDGDASWGGFTMVGGRWFSGAGEVVVPSTILSATGTKVGDSVTITVRGKPVVVRIVGEVFDTGNDGRRVFTDAATLSTAAPGLKSTAEYVDLKPGTDTDAYVTALNAELKPLGMSATSAKYANGSGTATVLDSLTALLTVLLVCVAGLGVLGGVVLDTHERVHDLGIHKALGMTPRQTVTMVVASVVLPGLAGGALGVPLGLAVHHAVLPAMGRAAGLRLPDLVVDVYGAGDLVLLGLAGVAVAVLGSLLPAGWAARIRTATALRAE
ncbi:ABC transporter permease [Streptomyces hokutonensis]|uniref:ABC transporter permease n=1 Tax=Streptomyces hokutonensis TaxID=1306990 RepID=UPI00035C54E3|nr:ABC transporter permease [Streptomyces hokutonensis]